MPCRRRQLEVARGTLKCGPLLLAPPNRRNRSMPRPPCSAPPPREACMLAQHHTAPGSQLPLLSHSCAAVDKCSVCCLLLFASHSVRDSQSFQHRTLLPVHACSLDSGPPRYDSLTVSDSPPSSESFVRSSVPLHACQRFANTRRLRDGPLHCTCLHCLLSA
jgi:hypothetical protein